MIRIGCLIVIGQMASNACSGCIDIITLMARYTIICNSCMSTGQYIIVAVDRERSWFPAWICRMAGIAGIWYIDSDMVGIGCLIIGSGMAY